MAEHNASIPRILCITPNPAVDRTMLLPTLKPGTVHRSYEIVVDAGGKGLNVARAVQRLGGVACCAGFLGGLSGQRIAQLAQAEGFDAAWTSIAAETRTCVIVATQDGEDATVLNENGPTVSAAEWAQLHVDVANAAQTCDLICECGSLPAESPPHELVRLIRSVEDAGRAIWVDTSGAALRAALDAAPSGLKVNHTEAGEVAGVAIETAEEAARVATSFHRHGIDQVAITLGARGAVLVNDAGSWWAHPPALHTVSAVGSGDCFLAGLVMAHARGDPAADALRQGVAAGAANALSAGGGRFDLEDLRRIAAQTQIVLLS